MKKIVRRQKKIAFIIILLCGIIVLGLVSFKLPALTSPGSSPSFWKFRSIDTMKYSRDLSREKLNDPSFNVVIDQQVKQIADTGASHVAIATPYDEEFLPILQRWVNSARKYKLSVWFRGNWSGWEEWFDYPKITRAEHIEKTEKFILDNPSLFRDGDVFSACPECENGGPGDPRMNGDAKGHREFLIEEYSVTKKAFQKIGKNVASNYHSMNGDIARLIMDKPTTQALDGLVVVDHYVATPEQLVEDIQDFTEKSGGKVILGEFGAPIPDLHGEMSEKEQAQWIKKSLHALVKIENFVGLNYWTSVGGSTELWDDDGTPTLAVKELRNIFTPSLVTLTVKNELGENINAAFTKDSETTQMENGKGVVPYLHEYFEVTVSAKGYKPETITITGQDEVIILKQLHESLFFKLRKFLKELY